MIKQIMVPYLLDFQSLAFSSLLTFIGGRLTCLWQKPIHIAASDHLPVYVHLSSMPLDHLTSHIPHNPKDYYGPKIMCMKSPLAHQHYTWWYFGNSDLGTLCIKPQAILNHDVHITNFRNSIEQKWGGLVCAWWFYYV